MGVAVAGIAAEGLLMESGIKSQTLARTLQQVGKDYGDPEFTMTKQTVVVLDESGMVPLRGAFAVAGQCDTSKRMNLHSRAWHAPDRSEKERFSELPGRSPTP
jgi:hypothetical protein